MTTTIKKCWCVLIAVFISSVIYFQVNGESQFEEKDNQVEPTMSNLVKVHYVKLKFTQSSFTLSIKQHIKDHYNAFSITLPTTEKFYNQIKVGQELDSKFKTATFILSGHIGNRKIIVEDKFIKYEPK